MYQVKESSNLNIILGKQCKIYEMWLAEKEWKIFIQEKKGARVIGLTKIFILIKLKINARKLNNGCAMKGKCWIEK